MWKNFGGIIYFSSKVWIKKLYFFTDTNNCELNPGCSLCFRVEELASALVEEKKLTAKLQSDWDTQEGQMEAFKKVV